VFIQEKSTLYHLRQEGTEVLHFKQVLVSPEYHQQGSDFNCFTSSCTHILRLSKKSVNKLTSYLTAPNSIIVLEDNKSKFVI